jgi:hypothetical protein
MLQPMSIGGRPLLFAWELPQNLLGAALLGIERLTGSALGIEHEHGRIFVESTRSAVSLGLFVFWRQGENRWFVLDEHTRAHEYGHTFQSRWLGPLYLPLVGVPSVARVGYAILHRELTGRRWTGYFDGYPENWADRLGGVPVEARRMAPPPRTD